MIYFNAIYYLSVIFGSVACMPDMNWFCLFVFVSFVFVFECGGVHACVVFYLFMWELVNI